MSFAFILTDAVLDDESPLELIPGYVLDRATREQIAEIKKFLTQNAHYVFGFPWEQQAIPAENGFSFEQLPFSQWRYRVINFSGFHENLDILDLALLLCQNELEVGPTALKDCQGAGWLHNVMFLSSFHAFPYPNQPVSIEVNSLKEVAGYFSKILDIKSNHPSIKRALDEYAFLKSLPRNSRFLTLGYFIVLESIITHQPNPSDSSDSLNRQIRSKMALLENRFCRRLDRSGFQPGIPPDTLWKRLYTYRSYLAHGATIDFHKGELTVLKSDEAVRYFMREAVKLVLIRAITEPRLILDLQQC